MNDVVCSKCGAVGTPRDQRTTAEGTDLVEADIFGYSVIPSADTPRHEHEHIFGYTILPYHCAAGHEWGQYTDLSCGCGWPDAPERNKS